MKNVITVIDGEVSVVTVLHDGEVFQAVAGYHPNFNLILERIGQDESDETVIDLFDIERHVKATFQRLTDRVTVRNGEVFVDGDSREGAIARQILKAVDHGQTDTLDSLVNFMEKVEQNPEPHSRKQLFDWLDKHEFTITSNGDIVGYKGVRVDGEGNYTSISQGPAVVNGEEVNGYVPNPLGAVVEMPRSSVHHDPREGCSAGLHVGTWDYASGFARGAVLEVHVNPRDVVSVPTDCNWQKVRCCRYKVVGVVTNQYAKAVVKADDDFNADVKVAVEAPEVRDPKGPFRVGDKVKTVRDVLAFPKKYADGSNVPLGTTATVTRVGDRDTYVEWDNGKWNNSGWLNDRFELVTSAPAPVGTWDTRNNHSKQKRYPKGHAKAGRFIPKNSSDYNLY